MSKDLKAKIGIYSLTLLSMAALGITPSISLIMAAFPDASATDVQQLTAIPNFMAIIMSLLFSVIANKVPRKAVAIAGPLLVAIGGLLPAFMGGSLMFLLVCSGIVGLGVGCISNIAQVLITDLISPENRQAAMAQNVIFVNIGAIIMTTGGGMLAANGWQSNYLIYLVALPVLLAAFIFIPFYKNELPEDAGQGAPKVGFSDLGITPFIVGGIILVVNLTYSVFPNNAAILIMGNGLGDTSSIGLINSVSTIGGMIAGVVLPKVLPRIQRFSLALGLCIMGVALIVLGSVANLTVMFVAAFFIGAALSVGFAQCPFMISLSVAPMVMPMAMACYSIGSSIGGTLSPTVVNGIAGALMGGAASDCCIVAGVIALVVAAVLLATRFQAGILDKAGLGK